MAEATQETYEPRLKARYEGEIAGKLREEFPELVDTPIAVEDAEGAPEGELPGDLKSLIKEGMSPEEVEAVVREHLAEKGIDADNIKVDVQRKDGDEHVEVRVEAEKHVECAEFLLAVRLEGS